MLGLPKRRPKSSWRAAGSEVYAVDQQVPLYEHWGKRGISGQIGTAPYAGEYVIARKLDLPWRKAETAFLLEFWREQLILPDLSDFYIDAYMVDTFHLDGTGSLLDYITKPLAIRWSADPAQFDAAEADIRRRTAESV